MNIEETIRAEVKSGTNYSVHTGDMICRLGKEYEVETVVVLSPDNDTCPIVMPVEEFTDEVKSLLS